MVRCLMTSRVPVVLSVTDIDTPLPETIKFIGNIEKQQIHRDRKKRPLPKHVKITLWIDNDSHYFSLYHEMPSICNVYVKFHDN